MTHQNSPLACPSIKHFANCLNDTSKLSRDFGFRRTPCEPKRFQRPKFSKNTARTSTSDCIKSVSVPSIRCALHAQVVGLGGLEPPASPLSGVRSNHLSYRPIVRPQRSLVRSIRRLSKSPQTVTRPDSRQQLVELIGIEPTTPCLQSRCSPS